MKIGFNTASIYEGRVAHQRIRPVAHNLNYRVFSLLIDLDAIGKLAKTLKFFSHNKFNLFSFYDRDHGGKDCKDIREYIRGLLKTAGINADGRIMLLCYPRILGYVFNPLSVYYCHDSGDRLRAVIYEVSNTFGDRHTYMIEADGDARRIRQSAKKEFHVSPFMDMDMRYDFDLTRPGNTVGVNIKTSDADGLVLNAVFSGARKPLSDRKLVSLFCRYPLMTLKVIAGIHWEAVRLLIKGMRLRGGPPAPEHASVIKAPVRTPAE